MIGRQGEFGSGKDFNGVFGHRAEPQAWPVMFRNGEAGLGWAGPAMVSQAWVGKVWHDKIMRDKSGRGQECSRRRA